MRRTGRGFWGDVLGRFCLVMGGGLVSKKVMTVRVMMSGANIGFRSGCNSELYYVDVLDRAGVHSVSIEFVLLVLI